jgi:hypothetical protein
METDQAKRIEATNAERYQLAGQYGWQFRPNAPELLERWPIKPFTERGDKRLAFGAVTGLFHGMPFTVFDYHRRPAVTSVHTRWTGKKVGEYDSNYIDTLWAVTLPAQMPYFQMVHSLQSVMETDGLPEAPTPNASSTCFT